MQHAPGPRFGYGRIGCAIILPLSHQLQSSTCVWIGWELYCTHEALAWSSKGLQLSTHFRLPNIQHSTKLELQITCTRQHRSPRIMGSCRGIKDECNTPQLVLVCRLQQLRLVTYGCSFTSGRVIKYALLFCTFLSLFCSCLTSALAPDPAPATPPLPVPLADLPGSWNAMLMGPFWYYYETKEGMGFFLTQFADVESRCTWSVIKSTRMLILTYYAQQLSVFLVLGCCQTGEH
jgi:hypothetical protein